MTMKPRVVGAIYFPAQMKEQLGNVVALATLWLRLNPSIYPLPQRRTNLGAGCPTGLKSGDFLPIVSIVAYDSRSCGFSVASLKLVDVYSAAAKECSVNG